MARVLLLEPWYRGSHRQWADGWQRHSAHDVTIVGSEEPGWRRGLATNPGWFARRIEQLDRSFDCVVASTPIDLAAVMGLSRRRLADAAVVLYAHETQAAYPRGPQGGSARAAMVADWYSMSTADEVWVASRHHQAALANALPRFLREFHGDPELAGAQLTTVAAKMFVLPVGIEPLGGAASRPAGPSRVLWNHRWAHDKAPERFVHAVSVLAGEGADFEVLALGDVERSGRKAHARLQRAMGDRLRIAANLDRVEYEAAVRTADLVVSTARHDFFGVAAAEALSAGARPVLPARLSYPELIPADLHDQLLHRGDLTEALRPLLELPREDLHRHQARTTAWVARFAWAEVAPQYDARISHLLGSAG